MDGSLFEILRQCPWGPTLAQHYQFQLPGACVSNSLEMQTNLLHDLHRQGQVNIANHMEAAAGLLAQLKRLLGIEPSTLRREYRVNPAVADVVDLLEQHGPGVLVLARLLPADQGGIQYAGHHAVLAICTFEAEGQHWAVALDGNYLQNNPVMKRVRAYAGKHLDGALEKITNDDLTAIRMQMKLDGDLGDPGQLVYSLINLDEAMRTADNALREYRKEFFWTGGYPAAVAPITVPNAIYVAKNVTRTGPPMPEEMKCELARRVALLPRYSTSLKVDVYPGEQ